MHTHTHTHTSIVGGSMKSKESKSLIPMALSERTVLARLVRWISGTAVASISSLYARSVYSLLPWEEPLTPGTLHTHFSQLSPHQLLVLVAVTLHTTQLSSPLTLTPSPSQTVIHVHAAQVYTLLCHHITPPLTHTSHLLPLPLTTPPTSPPPLPHTHTITPTTHTLPHHSHSPHPIP